MGSWQQKLFRYFAHSLTDASGGRLHFDLVGRVIDQIGEDDHLRARFSDLESEEAVGEAFLHLYSQALGQRD